MAIRQGTDQEGFQPERLPCTCWMFVMLPSLSVMVSPDTPTTSSSVWVRVRVRVSVLGLHNTKSKIWPSSAGLILHPSHASDALCVGVGLSVFHSFL